MVIQSSINSLRTPGAKCIKTYSTLNSNIFSKTSTSYNGQYGFNISISRSDIATILGCNENQVFYVRLKFAVSLQNVSSLNYVILNGNSQVETGIFYSGEYLTLPFIYDGYEFSSAYKVLSDTYGAFALAVLSDTIYIEYYVLQGIAVNTPPTKTIYNPGENFDPTGMIVLAYSGNYSESVTGYTVSPTTLDVGDEQVTISYFGKTTTQQILVNNDITYKNAAGLSDIDPENVKRNFPLAGGVNAEVDIKTGNTIFSFDLLSTEDSPLSVPIFHYLKSGETAFRLNLDETLTEITSGNAGENGGYSVGDYKYSANGKDYRFEKSYYYIDDSGAKTAVAANSVTIDPDGNLQYTANDKTYDVFREEQTETGLKLLGEYEDFEQSDVFESRSAEQKQLEEQVTHYYDIIKGLRIVNDSGTENSIFEQQSNPYSYEAYTGFLETLHDNNYTRYLLTKSQSDNFGSVTSETLLSNSAENEDDFKKSFKELFNAKHQLEELEKQIPDKYISDGDTVKAFNKSGKLAAIYDKFGNVVSFEYDDEKIVGVYNGDAKEITLGYNADGTLKEISDDRGRKITYSYSGGNLSSVIVFKRYKLVFVYSTNNKLLKIKAGDGTFLSGSTSTADYESQIGYTGDDITSISNVTYLTKIAFGTETKTSSSTLINSYTFKESNDERIIVYTDNSSALSRTYGYIYGFTGDFLSYYKEIADYAETTGGGSFTGTIVRAENFVKDSANNKITQYGANRKLLNNAGTADLTTAQTQNNADEEFSTKKNSFNDVSQVIYKDLFTSAYDREQTTTNYIYDKGHKVTEEQRTVSKWGTTYGLYKYYYYNAAGALVKEESFVQGEENVSGKNVTEYFYDEKGNASKTVSYNTLDASSKFYDETEYGEKGEPTAVYDETGENKTEYRYADGTLSLRETVLPNGSRYGYGADETDDVTAITQNTADGEENSTQKFYNKGLIAKVLSGNNEIKYEYDGKGRNTKIIVNGQTKRNISYSVSNGNEVITVTTPQNETYKTTKDKDGNVVSFKYGSTVQWSATYNKNGDMISLTDGTPTEFSYDHLGRIKTYSADLNESFSYNFYDALTERTLTFNGITQKYSFAYKTDFSHGIDYTAIGNENAFDYKIIVKRDANGRNIGKDICTYSGLNRAGENVAYLKKGDHATNIPNVISYTKGGVVTDDIKYAYDKMGNISEVRENGKLVARYFYDGINRLVREDNRLLNKTVLLTYDSCGNITAKRTAAFTLAKTDEISAFTDEKIYTYKGDLLQSYGGTAITYDGCGNPLSYKGNTLTWNKDRLASYDNISFTYNGRGQRTAKAETVNGNTTTKTYLYDSGGKLIYTSDGLTFFYDHQGIAGFKYNSSTYFYRKDITGNVIAIINNLGDEIVRYVYDAWGNHTVTDASANNIGTLNPFRYRSYFYDDETGLYYLKTRYYDPETGRFISPDDFSYLSPDTINGLNLYAYCGNNPVMNVDPNGNAWWHWLVAAVVVVGLAVATAVTAGGALAGAGAIMLAAGGVASVSTATTVLAFSTVATATVLTASAVVATINSAETISATGNFSAGVNTFMDYGETALISTISAGGCGAVIGYFSHFDVGIKTPGKLRPFGTYYNSNDETITHYGLNGKMWWSKHLDNHGNSLNHTIPHWHAEMPHYPRGGFNNVSSLIKELIKRLFGGGHK